MRHDDFASYDGDLDHEGYRFLHGLEIEIESLKSECIRLTQLFHEQEKRILDLEASHFADGVERTLDLERWDGIHASHVGHDLEEIADKLIAAIEAEAHGEDLRGKLYEIHGDLCCVMADISTGG